LKRTFHSIINLCLILVIMLSSVPIANAQVGEQPHSAGVTEPICSDKTTFLKGLILTAILEEQPSINVPEFLSDAEEAESILLDVINENMNRIRALSDYRIANGTKGLMIRFEYAEPSFAVMDARANNVKVEAEKQRILSLVDDSMSDMEKALVVHDYMALNYEYDLTYSIYSAEGMFEHKTGVCQAYALAFKEIMTELDIPCQVVPSYAMNHAWNLVKIDGEWYHVDITWDDPVPDRLGRVRHVFFLVSDEAISDPNYYERPHYDWEKTDRADSDRYDHYFWKDINSAIIHEAGNFYYIGSNGCIMQKNITTGAESSLYEIDAYWLVWDDPSRFWIGCFSGLGLYHNRLYFNTPTEIKSIGLDGTNVYTVYTPDTSAGYLYGLSVNGTTITYGFAKNADLEIESTGMCDPSGAPIISVESIAIDQNAVSLLVDETCTLTATVLPQNATNKKVHWSSSNTDVASVEDGVVTANDAGTVTIRATTDDGYLTAVCRVKVSYDLDIMVEGDDAVAQGKTITLKAYAYYKDNGTTVKTNDEIGWRSSDESVATVSKGKVKGIGAGQVTITAYIEDTDVYTDFEVNVVAPVTSLKFAPSKATVYVGNTFDLAQTLTIKPFEHTDTIEWSSSKESVATVDEDGVVTPITTGTAKITAKAAAGKKAASVTITVAREPEEIEITGDHFVAQGKTITLKAYAFYEENGKITKTKDAICWESSDESVATVSKGKVKGIGAGQATITAYIEDTDVYTEFEVNVVAPITSLKFASSKATVYVGNDFDLAQMLTIKPFEHTDSIEWSSSKESVATVDEHGVVTPIATGTAKITAKAAAGKKTASVTITVAREPEAIEIIGDCAVARGKTITLKAYAFYEENGKIVKTKDAISWESSDESVATVSKGKVKGIGAGQATITAYIEALGLQADYEVTVAIPAKSVKLSIKKLTAAVGDTFDLTGYLTVTPDDNTDEIIWTTSKSSVATVEDGYVTIVGEGSAKITAKAVAGKKSASVTITVK